MTIKHTCEWGCTQDDLDELLGTGDKRAKFNKWMDGQTQIICEGRKYNHDTEEYYPSCGGVSHGIVAYTWDVERFLDGRPGWR